MRRKKKFGGITVDGVEKKEEKNWGTQIGMALLLGVFFCGPLVAHTFGWHMPVAAIGVSVAIDILLLLAIALWALRTWDY